MSIFTTLTRPVMLYHRIEIVDASAGAGLTAGAVFGLGLPLVVTNSLGTSLGGVLGDAKVTITLAEGGVADDFEIVLYDLPSPAASAIKAKAGKSDQPGLSVTIRLGYLDSVTTVFTVSPVLRGRVTEVREGTTDDGRSTLTLRGFEEVGYVLRGTAAEQKTVDEIDADTLIGQLLDAAKKTATKLKIDPAGIHVVPGTKLGQKLTKFTTRGSSVLSVLASIADTAKQALVVSSDGVAFGPAVGAGAVPITLSADTNAVKMRVTVKEKPAGDGSSAAADPDALTNVVSALVSVAGVTPDQGGDPSTAVVSAIGDTGLRVGRFVVLPDDALKDPLKGKKLRIYQVKHVYNTVPASTTAKTPGTPGGFTTEVTVTADGSGAPAAATHGAKSVWDALNVQLRKGRGAHPTIDVGQASTYLEGKGGTATAPGHRVTLHYGPGKPDAKVTTKSPSIDQPVNTDDRTDLVERPVASPFAFDKVGLITPVYAGMRAVLVHNGAAKDDEVVNDAVVAGWVWPTAGNDQALTPPPNLAGDYWLALPTAIDTQSKRPTGKGVNDLTDASGNRVITTNSARIVVGHSALDDVGTRPQPGKDDELVIEHASGTKITIDSSGAVTIDSADAVSLTTKGKDITVGNGAVSLKLSGASVQVGA